MIDRFRLDLNAAVLFLFCSCVPALSQEQPDVQEKPTTKLETASVEKGAILIRGLEKISAVSGDNGSNAEITAISIRNVQTKSATYGITVTLIEQGPSRREGTFFVDADELDDFSHALDYLGEVKKSVSSFRDFEAIYHTRGDVSVIAFSDSTGNISLDIRGGLIGSALNVFLDMPKLPQLKSAIEQAKKKIADASAEQK